MPPGRGPDHEVEPVDPFDLPEWVGSGPVTWTLLTSLARGPLVAGELSARQQTGAGGAAGDREAGEPALPCDLLACDVAYPVATLVEQWRHDAHQAWVHGQVLLLSYDGRLTLAVPGTGFSADLALEAIARLAKAVGAAPDLFTVAMRL